MDFLIGGVASMGAAIFSNPFEVVKTRMQLQGELQSKGTHAIHYKNVFHAFYTIGKHDGLRALQSGLTPSLCFQLFINGIRLGIFQLSEDTGLVLDSSGNYSYWRAVLAGAIGGGIGSAFGSPFSLIRTQFQSMAVKEIAVGYQHQHENLIMAIRNIYAKDGIKGLFRGLPIQVPRAAIGSGVQLMTFSRCREYLVKNQTLPGTTLNTLLASAIGGTVTTIATAPIDVMSTRIYNQGVDKYGRGLTYNGVFDCFNKIVLKEGLPGFYKGFWPSYFRMIPHTVLTLVFWDELKILRQKYNEQININLLEK